jgi:hypothetical protein
MSTGVGAGAAYRPVFVLGAGFSKAIDSRMPTSEDLGAKVKELLKNEGQPLPAELTRGTFEEWLSRLADDQPDLWEHENLQRRAWFSQISRAVARVIEECEDDVRHDESAPPPLWLRAFIGAAHGWRATVVTLNYDTLLEGGVNGSSFHDFEVVVGNNRVRSCDVLGHLPRPAEQAEIGPYSTFQLLKLHGSVNFYRASGDEVGASLARWPLEGESHDPELSHRPTVRYLRPVYTLGSTRRFPPGKQEGPAEEKRRALFGYEPLIVPPAALKSPYYNLTFLRGLWRQAREAVQQASHVYLVGYSLPATDLVTVGLLRENLAPNAQVLVVNRPNKDGSEDVATRAKRLLGQEVEPVHPGSDEAIKLWVKDLAERRSRETVRSLLADLEQKVERHDTSYKVHVKVHDENGEGPCCLQESTPDQDLRCVEVTEPPMGLEQQPKWQAANLIETLRGLSDSASTFSVIDTDGSERFIVDAYVRGPASPSFVYSVELQSVST